MKTRVRKLGVGWPWVTVESEDCVFCVLAAQNLKNVGEVIFFETAAGAVQRTECIGVASDGAPAFFCFECTREEALEEIAAAAAEVSMDDKKERLRAVLQRNPEAAMDIAKFFFLWKRMPHADIFASTCALCFAPPGVSCNTAPGWCGAVDAGEHARVPIADPCGVCNGTGSEAVGIGPAIEFTPCKGCNGSRRAPE